MNKENTPASISACIGFDGFGREANQLKNR
jgi:hypothetical protein